MAPSVEGQLRATFETWAKAHVVKRWKPKLVDPSSPEEKRTKTPEEATNDVSPAWQTAPWVDDSRLSRAALLLLTAAALYVGYILFRPFVTAAFLAFVLSIAFNPFHAWVARRIRSNNVAALTTTILIMLCIIVPLIFISLKVLTEAGSLYSSLALKRGSGGWYDGLGGISDTMQRVAERTGIPMAQLKSAVMGRVQVLGLWMVSVANSAARRAVQQMITALLVFLVLFFLFRDREEYRRGLFGVLPLQPRRVVELTKTIHECISANIYGMFAVGLVQGVLTAVGFWATGLRSPLLWGLMAMLFSFVPLVGPILVWAPGCLVLVTQGDWIKALALMLWGAIIVSGADYLIRPKLAGGSIKVNRLLILLSFLGGVKAFGAIGIFVGPVTLSLIVALFRILREEYARRSSISEQAA